MEISPVRIDELRQRIMAVFPQAAPPPPENIISHACEECYGVRDAFREVGWWMAADELIEENYDKLPLFTPEAHHYYLPAFLLRALETFLPDNPVLEFCVYDLSPTKTAKDNPRYSARLNQFTLGQISVVSGFLECILEDERFYAYYADAERGIRNFRHVIQDESSI